MRLAVPMFTPLHNWRRNCKAQRGPMDVDFDAARCCGDFGDGEPTLEVDPMHSFYCRHRWRRVKDRHDRAAKVLCQRRDALPGVKASLEPRVGGGDP